MSDNIPETPEARWKHLREEGIKRLIDLSSNDKIADKPSWLDEKRFEKAKATVQKFFLGVQFSSLTGLLLVLQLPDALEPLLSTGNSKDIPSLYRRYLSTITHIESWYDDDIFDPTTKGYRSIRQVRAMHKRIQDKMNNKFDASDINGQPRIWFNQYDVALTQFAFIGLALLYPRKSAMIGASHEDLEHINYYWRVLGHLMGIDDQFNACQFDKYEDIREFHRLIFQHGYMEDFKEHPCQKGLEMTQSLCKALQYYIPLTTFNSLACWWSECFQFNGYEPQPLTAREKILSSLTWFSFNHLFKYNGSRKLFTRLHRRMFEQRLKNKTKVHDKLKKRYDAKPTFYSDRFDYFNKEKDNELHAIAQVVNQVDTNLRESAMDKQSVCPFGFGIQNQEERNPPLTAGA